MYVCQQESENLPQVFYSCWQFMCCGNIYIGEVAGGRECGSYDTVHTCMWGALITIL